MVVNAHPSNTSSHGSARGFSRWLSAARMGAEMLSAAAIAASISSLTRWVSSCRVRPMETKRQAPLAKLNGPMDCVSFSSGFLSMQLRL